MTRHYSEVDLPADWPEAELEDLVNLDDRIADLLLTAFACALNGELPSREWRMQAGRALQERKGLSP